MFGKIEDGVLILAPTSLKINGRVYYNRSEQLMLQSGYLPIEITPCPDSGIHQESYEEREGKIVQIWPAYVPEPQPLTTEQRLQQAENELITLKSQNERLTAEIVYLCMMNGVEPSEVSYE